MTVVEVAVVFQARVEVLGERVFVEREFERVLVEEKRREPEVP